jgi:hypothetical protein
MNCIAVNGPSTGGTRSTAEAEHASAERRKSRRVPLQWTVYVACSGGAPPLRTKTQNISSEGFYCLLDQAVMPGEEFDCDIVVPTHNSPEPDEVMLLRCRAQAIRVDQIGSGLEFGLACRIEDYCLNHATGRRATLQNSPHSALAALHGNKPVNGSGLH